MHPIVSSSVFLSDLKTTLRNRLRAYGILIQNQPLCKTCLLKWQHQAYRQSDVFSILDFVVSYSYSETYRLGKKKRVRKYPGVTQSLKCQLLFMVVAFYCTDSQKGIIPRWLLSLQKLLLPKLPPSHQSQNPKLVSELLHFWWGIPLGYLVFDELKMTSFLLALGLIITVCWEYTAVGEETERAETQLFG